MLDSSAFDIEAKLSPVRRGLGLHRAGTWTSRGVALGAGVGVLILLTGRFLLGHPPVPLAVAAVIVGLATAAALAVLHWPSAFEAARATDQHFSLQDRVTTALEYQHSREPLVLLQRRDLARLVDRLPLVRSAPPIVNRRDVAFLATALVLFAGALALPVSQPAHRAVARTNGQDIGRIRQVALAHLASISRNFQASLTPQQRRSDSVRQALAAISSLRTQLRRAHSKEEALREISDAQARLQQVGSILHPVSGSSARALTKTMHGYMTHQQNTDAVKGGSKLGKAASDLLKHLAASTGQQSAGQQQQTARALMKAANKVSDDQVKSDLQRAASSLGHGDAKSAQQALNHAASRFSASHNTQRTKSALSNARRSLDKVKNDISGLKQKSAESRPGNGQNALASARSRLKGGREAAGSQGVPPLAANAKKTHGKGNKTRSTNTEDSRNLGGAADQAGKRSGGKYAVVFVPGLVRQGQHFLPVELKGRTTQLPLVPYKQVIARYGKSARTALDRSALPPSLQDYVRKYFTVLSH